ncbi:MAG: hypothetical protein IJ766_03805 [Clostridia bacterium]|nr:hypothetical protein [Clostridia bacterium]
MFYSFLTIFLFAAVGTGICLMVWHDARIRAWEDKQLSRLRAWYIKKTLEAACVFHRTARTVLRFRGKHNIYRLLINSFRLYDANTALLRVQKEAIYERFRAQ